MNTEPSERSDHVLVVGESLIDIVSEPSAGTTTEHVGGSPANVALGVSRLGVPTRLHTALGRDSRGERISDHMLASGVTIAERSWTLARTATAHATIGPDGSAHYDFDISWMLDGKPDVADAELIHTGSIAAFLQPGAASVRALLRENHGQRIITFDPNIRPALIGTHAAAVETFEELSALADVVKFSDEDAAWLYPSTPIQEVMQRVLSLGPRIVTATAGARGSLLLSRLAQVHAPAPQVDVVDTVGAGDSISAAIVVRLIRQGDLLANPDSEALTSLGEFATAVATKAVQRAGADLPLSHEVGSP